MSRSERPAQASPWLSAAAMIATTALLFPALRGAGWFVTSAAVILALTGAQAAMVRRRAPQALAVVAEMVLLLLTLVVMYARDVAPLGFVPGPAAMHRIFGVFSDAIVEANRTKPPAVPTAGLMALVILAVGLLTIALHALDQFADPIGLGWPLLILYAGASGIERRPIPWYLFAIAAVGWLALIAGRERARLAEWGRALDAPRLALMARAGRQVPTGSPDLARLSTTARRVGGAALACAVLLPIVFPAGSHLGFFSGFGSGSGHGHGGSVVSIDPTVSLKRDLLAVDNRVVLTYRVEAGAVPYIGSPGYLRMDVLEQFDGVTWTSRTSDVFHTFGTAQPWPVPEGTPDGVQLDGPTFVIKIGPLDGRSLPIPPLAGSIRVDGSWFYDSATQTVRTAKESMQNLSYTVKTWEWPPTAQELRAAPAFDLSTESQSEAAEDLAVPVTTPAGIVALAHKVAGKATNAYDRAIAIQTWLRTNFTYSTNVAYSDGTTALEAFLRDRTGYCQQFAATMALFARILGIPSRVAVGFTSGTPRPDGSYAVSVHDAHAWPELYFTGIGWVRFEPTPRNDVGNTVALPSYAVNDGNSSTPTTPGGTTQNSGNGKVNKLNRADSGLGVGAVLAVPRHPLTKGEVVRYVALALLLLLLLVPVLRRTRRSWRLHRGSDRFEATWRELLASCGDLGRPLSPSLTPRQVGEALRGLDPSPQFAAHVAVLVDGVEATRYARPGSLESRTAGGQSRHAVAELRAVRRTLWRRASWSTRMHSLLRPSWS